MNASSATGMSEAQGPWPAACGSTPVCSEVPSSVCLATRPGSELLFQACVRARVAQGRCTKRQSRKGNHCWVQ